MLIIVGLGNPGEKYINTRHNLGFQILDHFAKKHLGPEIEWEMEKKFSSEILKVKIGGADVLLVKSQTFMNASGEAVSRIRSFYKVKTEDIVVVHDDLDLPLGKIRVRVGGSAAGHHGVESIINLLGDDKFTRVRVGIGNVRSVGGERGEKNFDAEKFVVSEFISSERGKLKHIYKTAVEAIDLILKEGFKSAQNQFN